MKHFKVKSSRFNKKWINPKSVVLACLGVFLLVSQTYLFITRGTLFGYQLRTVEPKSPTNTITSRSQKPSIACDQVTQNEVDQVLGVKMERVAGIFGDITTPNLVSNCIYRSKQTPSRTVTIILRDLDDNDSAKTIIDKAQERKGAKQVDNLGEQAIFIEKSRQLQIRQGKRLFTITVSKPVNESKISSEEAAIKIGRVAVQ